MMGEAAPPGRRRPVVGPHTQRGWHSRAQAGMQGAHHAEHAARDGVEHRVCQREEAEQAGRGAHPRALFQARPEAAAEAVRAGVSTAAAAQGERAEQQSQRAQPQPSSPSQDMPEQEAGGEEQRGARARRRQAQANRVGLRREGGWRGRGVPGAQGAQRWDAARAGGQPCQTTRAARSLTCFRRRRGSSGPNRVGHLSQRQQAGQHLPCCGGGHGRAPQAAGGAGARGASPQHLSQRRPARHVGSSVGGVSSRVRSHAAAAAGDGS